MRKDVQLERSGLHSLKIDDDYAVNSPSDRSVKFIFAYPFGCHLAIFYTYLAADLPYFEFPQISMDVTFLFVTKFGCVNLVGHNINPQLNFIICLSDY